MKLINRYYTGPKSLDALSAAIPDSAPTLLIQIYTRRRHPADIKQLITCLLSRFPRAHIAGMTCYGTLVGEEFNHRNTLLSILQLTTATVRSALVQAPVWGNAADMHAIGRMLARQVASANTRALVLFINHDGMDPTALLEGIETVCPGIPISGGVASMDATVSGPTMIWHNSTISDHGAVLVALGGEQLTASQHVITGLAPLGKRLRVTHAEGTRLITLEHQPTLAIYKRYLGADVADSLPDSAMGFPLLAVRNGKDVALAARERFSDGSIRFAAPLKQGESVCFGFPHAQHMLNGARHLREQLQRQGSTEAMLVFACPFRAWILGQNTPIETGLLRAVAPLGGCLTGGEFFLNGTGNQFQNQSMTILALREARNATTRRADGWITTPEPELDSIHLRMVKVLHGMTSRISEELTETNQVLNRERTFYRTLIEQSLDGVSLFDAHGQSLYQSQANAAIHGWKPEELAAMNVGKTLVHQQDQAKMVALWKRLVAEPGARERMELRFLHRDGHWITLEAQIHNCLSLPGITAMVNYFRDITALKRLEFELRHLATTDSLTMLSNRRHFMERAQQERRRSQRNKTELAVVIVDIDHFKRINDTYGHATGDQVIVRVAELLQGMMRDQDVAGRLGGEEFALLLPDTSLEGARILAERLRVCLEAQALGRSNGQDLQVTASFGIAAMQSGNGDMDVLLRTADAALYTAKKAGRNCVRP